MTIWTTDSFRLTNHFNIDLHKHTRNTGSEEQSREAAQNSAGWSKDNPGLLELMTEVYVKCKKKSSGNLIKSNVQHANNRKTTFPSFLTTLFCSDNNKVLGEAKMKALICVCLLAEWCKLWNWLRKTSPVHSNLTHKKKQSSIRIWMGEIYSIHLSCVSDWLWDVSFLSIW